MTTYKISHSVSGNNNRKPKHRIARESPVITMLRTGSLDQAQAAAAFAFSEQWANSENVRSGSMDLSRDVVDGGRSNWGSVSVSRLDAEAKMKTWRKLLDGISPESYHLIESVFCKGAAISEIATTRCEQDKRRALLRKSLDCLAENIGLRTTENHRRAA